MSYKLRFLSYLVGFLLIIGAQNALSAQTAPGPLPTYPNGLSNPGGTNIELWAPSALFLFVQADAGELQNQLDAVWGSGVFTALTTVNDPFVNPPFFAGPNDPNFASLLMFYRPNYLVKLPDESEVRPPHYEYGAQINVWDNSLCGPTPPDAATVFTLINCTALVDVVFYGTDPDWIQKFLQIPNFGISAEVTDAKVRKKDGKIENIVLISPENSNNVVIRWTVLPEQQKMDVSTLGFRVLGNSTVSKQYITFLDQRQNFIPGDQIKLRIKGDQLRLSNGDAIEISGVVYYGLINREQYQIFNLFGL